MAGYSLEKISDVAPIIEAPSAFYISNSEVIHTHSEGKTHFYKLTVSAEGRDPTEFNVNVPEEYKIISYCGTSLLNNTNIVPIVVYFVNQNCLTINLGSYDDHLLLHTGFLVVAKN